MLSTLLIAPTLSCGPPDRTSRLQAAAELEAVLQRAGSPEGTAWRALQLGLDAARKTLGPESEVANEQQGLARGARLKALLGDGEGTPWLAGGLDRTRPECGGLPRGGFRACIQSRVGDEAVDL